MWTAQKLKHQQNPVNYEKKKKNHSLIKMTVRNAASQLHSDNCMECTVRKKTTGECINGDCITASHMMQA